MYLYATPCCLEASSPFTLLPVQVATSVELEDGVHDRYIRANLDDLTIQIERRTYALQQRRCSHACTCPCVLRVLQRWSWFVLY
jgi:hypothetical protein